MSIDLDPSEVPPERPERPAVELPKRPGSSAGRGTGDGAPSTSRPADARTAATMARQEGELSIRIQEALNRVAIALQNRNPDSEMAEALHEDGKKMADSLVNVTRRIPLLRKPLLWFLSAIEPVLAFGRVVRIGFYGVANWRGGRQEMQGPEDGNNGNP